MRGRPVLAAGGSDAPHRMHTVGYARLMVVVRMLLILGRCASRAVSSPTKLAGLRSARGVAIDVEQRLVWTTVRVPFIIDRPREQSFSGVHGRSRLAPMGWQ